jgi:hypothetical protein
MASIFTVVSSVEHVIICCTFTFPIFSWHIVYILILSQVNNWNSIFPNSTNSTRKMIVAQLSAFWKFKVFIANGAKPSSTYHLAFLRGWGFTAFPSWRIWPAVFGQPLMTQLSFPVEYRKRIIPVLKTDNFNHKRKSKFCKENIFYMKKQ